MDNLAIFCAKYLIFLVALAVFIYWLKLAKPRKITMALSIISALIIVVIMVKIAGKLYYHPRPFVVENIQPLIKHGTDNGFPSEHATFSALLAVSTYFFNRKLGIGLFVAAVVVGWGRLAAHVHSPIDVVAGLVFGAVAAWLGYKVADKFLVNKLPLGKDSNQ